MKTAEEEEAPKKRAKGGKKNKEKVFDVETLLKYDGPRIEGLSFKVCL
jgi:hypothetical protein